MTPRQIELARHALGLRGGKIKQSFRNYFVAGMGHVDHKDWKDMVAKGFAVCHQMENLGGSDIFRLKRRGAEKALLSGESLDPEAFPRRRAA
jgi:hypothetical protein